ncbi:MAG: hypothetical protein CSA52_03785 [Gammaproteobacteria bacterium]|nr:MAG: hypothetical protein CSA52_03785 [Gammaproteobacteria bacterium]
MSYSLTKKWQETPKATRFAVIGVIALVIFWDMFDGSYGGSQVTVMDRGLNMPAMTYTLPEDWTLKHDVVFDSGSGHYSKYLIEIHDPNGGMAFTNRYLQFVVYGSALRMLSKGLPFDQAWKNAAYQALQQNFANIRFGEALPQGEWASLMSGQIQGYLAKKKGQLSKGEIAQFSKGEFLEADIQAQRDGQNFRGKALMIRASAVQPDSGNILMSLVIAPEGHFSDMMAGYLQILEQVKSNPEYARTKQQFANQAMQRSQVAHQTRMANQRSNFEAHQNLVNQRSAQQDANFQQWMGDFRNDGTTPSAGGSYTGQDYLVDSIHERQTFYDPDSGYNVSRDGQYDYNYTDGMGNFYGTNNPSFNPDSLQGDWRRAEVLTPNN